MASGNMGGLDFSLGIRDEFSKPLSDLEKKLKNVLNYASSGSKKSADDMQAALRAYDSSIENVKKGINKLQYAFDEAGKAAAKIKAKNPFADTSSFDKVQEKIRGIARDFEKIISVQKIPDGWAKSFSGFFGSADLEFRLHQINSLMKAAKNEANAQSKSEEQYWKREERAIERAANAYQQIGRQYLSLSKLKAQLAGQETASPKDEAIIKSATAALDGYIEKMAKAKAEFRAMADAGMAQGSSLGKGTKDIFTSEFWTAKNGAIEALRMVRENWNALTAEQKNAAREQMQLLENQTANSKTALNAQKAIEQQEKRNEQAFVAEQKAIDATIERLAKLQSLYNKGIGIKDNKFLSKDESDKVAKDLIPLLEKINELRSYLNTGTYAPNLFNRGTDKAELDTLNRLISDYEKLVRVREQNANQAQREQDAQNRNLIANSDKVKNITSLIEAMQKRWADIQADPKFGSLTLPSGFNKQIKDLENLKNALQQLSTADLGKVGSVTDLLSRRHFGTLRREINAIFSEIEKGYKKTDRDNDEHTRKVERNLEIAKRNYARLFDQLNTLRNIRANYNLLGINTKELDEAIDRVLRKLKTLRAYKNFNLDPGKATNFSLYNDADGKREEELVNRLIRKYQDLNREKGKSNIETISGEARAARELASAFDRIHNSASKTSQVLSDIKSLFFQGGIVFGAQQLFNELVRTGGEIVQQHVALQTIVGDLQDANQLFGQIQDLALRSPFTFGKLNRDVKQLAAFGVETDQLYDKTKRIADISSGLGVSFERLGLAYGQVKARSWLDGKELRQFAYAGLPMLQKLADYYSKTRGGTYTTSQVRDMISKRQVSFEDVDAIFDELTEKGGQFYNMQDKLSNTLLGRYMKLKDAWDIMMSGFADGKTLTGSFFSWVLDRVTALIQALNTAGPVIAALFAGAGLRKAMAVFGGRTMKDLVSAKASLATKLQEKALTEQLSAAEMRILQSKGRITAEDLKNEAILRQINKQEARRLFISGQINKQQYLRLMAYNRQQQGSNRTNPLSAFFGAGNWSDRMGAAVRGGMGVIGNIAKGLWGMIGGLPGLIITGITTITAIAIQKHHELVASQERAREELSDRGTQMKDFSKDYNVKDIIAKGEEAVDNAIEAYKEKLKELAPYNYEVYEMTANEKESHEERLRYLSEQLELLKQANNLANKNSSKFVDETRDSFKDVLENLRGKIKANSTYADTITDPISGLSVEDQYDYRLDVEMKNLAKKISETLPNVGKDPKVTEAAKQLMSNMMAQLSFSPQEELFIRVKLGSLLKIPDSENALADEARTRMQKLIQTAKVTLGKGVTETGEQLQYKIKYGQHLNKAEEDKLVELRQQALSQLKADFPAFADELQKLFSSKKFQVDVYANFVGGAKPDKLEKDIMEDVPAVTKTKIRDLVQQWAKLNPYEAQNTIQQEGDKRYNEWLTASKNKHLKKETVQEYKQSYDDFLKAVDLSGYHYAPTAKKSNRTPKGRNNGDSAARKADNEDEKRLRARLRLIQEAYQTYKKYYKLLHSESEAAKKVSAQYKNRGLSNDDVSKIQSAEGYKSLIEDYIKRAQNVRYRRPKEMQERKDEDIAAGVNARNGFDYDQLSDDMQDFSSVVSTTLDEMTRKWENYKSILKATGDTSIAANISGLSSDTNSSTGDGLGIVSNYSDFLKNYINTLLSSSKNPSTSIDYDKVLGMSDKEIDKYAGNLFAEDDSDKVEGLASALKKLKEIITNSELKKGLEKFNDLMGKVVTSSAEQERIDTEHKETENDLNRLDKSPEEIQKAKDIEDVSYNENTLKASDDYKRFANNIISMTSEMANDVKSKAIDILDRKMQLGIITADDYAKAVGDVNDKMFGLTEKQTDLQAFLTGGIDGFLNNQRTTALSNIQLGSQLLQNDPNSQEGKNLVNKGKGQLQTYINNKQDVSQWSNLNKSVHSVANAFNNLVGVLQPIIDTASAFGNKGIAEGTDIAQKSIQSGLGVADDMKGMADVAKGVGLNGVSSALGNAGPYGAAAAAALQIGSQMLNKFGFGASANKAYERQEKYYQKVLSTMQDINSNLEKRVSSSYGSQSIVAARKLIDNYRVEAQEARETYGKWSQAHTIHKNHRNRMYVFGGKGETSDYLTQINSYLRANGYDGEEVGGDSIQNLDAKWLKMIKEDIPDAWTHMDEKAQEYLNKIIETEEATGDVKEATIKLNEALTGMSFETLRQEYNNLLNELDSSNEDFANNFENHMREAILNSMVSNLYKNELEGVIQDIADMGKNDEYVDKYGHIKKHTKRDSKGNLTYDEDDIASEYTAAEYDEGRKRMQQTTEDIRNTRDNLRDYYGWTDANSSSMSSSIKGITEDTADLLAAYLNAIRADVSVIRQYDGLYWPKLDITTQAQLQQLNMISANTLRNADAAEQIQQSMILVCDILSASRNNTRPLYVTVK